jgi:hypothetical protein
MAERILGETGSTRRRRFLLVPLVLLCVGLFMVAGGQALPPNSTGSPNDSGLFQLDRDTLPATCQNPFPGITLTSGDDWAALYTQANPPTSDATPCGSDGFSFVADGGAADHSYWSQGGSKDVYDPALGPWRWSSNDVSPDKNDIQDAFAAMYHVGTTPNVTKYLYFGSDRLDTSGDAQQGFQFLQNAVCLQAAAGTTPANGLPCPASTPSTPTGCTPAFSGSNAGRFVDPGTGCPAHHKNGDLLVLVNFNNGGTIGSSGVYEWWGANASGAGCYGTPPKAGPPATAGICDQPVLFGNGADCKTILGANDFCATSNTATLANEPIWPYTNKDGGHSYLPSSFAEGGINLSHIPGAGTCFPAFLAETRSSSGPGSGTGLQAQLKDLAMGQFQLCKPKITITPNGVNAVGSQHTFTVKVTNLSGGVETGVAGIKPTVTITPAPASKTDNCATGVTNAAGECTIVISSPTAGVFTAHATATFTIDGTQFTVATDGTAPNSGDAIKRFVDTNVSITPNGVNKVGDTHTFTVSTTGIPSGTTATLLSMTPHVSPATTLLNNNCTNSANWGGSGLTRTCTFQISSSSAGTFVATADSSWKFDDADAGANPATVTVNRTTDSTHGSSGSVIKRFVDANVSITPNGVNKVGDTHTFTVSTTGIPSGTTATLLSITPHVNPSTTLSNNTCATPANWGGSGLTRTCTFQISSNSAGTFVATADSSWKFDDADAGANPATVTVNRTTDGTHGSSGYVTKRFVDANISITPDGVNKVGDTHTFNVSTTADPQGTTASLLSITPHVNPSTTLSNNTCATPAQWGGGGNTRTCSFQISSNSAGTFVATADSSWKFDDADAGANPATVTVNRTTDGTHGSSGSVTKRFVDANISIAQNGVNEVGHQHVFTITTNSIPSGTVDSLTSITPSVTTAIPAASLTTSNTCDAAGIVFSNNGHTATCTLTVNSTVPGVVTANATAIWHYVDNDANANPASTNVTRSTDSTHGSSGPATKRFVDARISIGPPLATNTVGDPHTFTVTFEQNDGLAANEGGDGVTGFGPVPDNTQVIVTLDPGASGAVPTLAGTGNTCMSPGTTNGICTVTFTSATAGTVTGNADAFVTVSNVPLERDTFGNTNIPCGDKQATCGPAVKIFVAGSIAWTKVDNANRLQGGATFSLCKTANYDLTSKTFVDLQTKDCSFGPAVDNTGQMNYTGADTDNTPGKFKVIGLSLGRYEVHETVAPPGYNPDPDTVVVELTPNDPGPPVVNHSDAVITEAFVNTRPILKITGFGYTNAPEGAAQPDGIFKGKTIYTAKLHNYGTAAADLNNSSLKITSGNSSLTCDGTQDGGLTLPITGSIAVDADSADVVLTCHYDHPLPKAITATLTVKYTTNGLERTASGSPATITYTVDPN